MPMLGRCLHHWKRNLLVSVLVYAILYFIVRRSLQRSDNLINSIFVSVDTQRIVTRTSTPKSHYDFVAFKKKAGWNFGKFSSRYQCKANVSTTVRYTDNPSDIVGADAVFFSTGPFTFDEWTHLHRYRTLGQVWVMATQEPASIVPRLLPPKIYRYTTYNWSFTFHSASDVHGAYGWFTPYKRKSGTKLRNWHSEKPKLAAWVSSRHCEGLGWDRTKLVIALSRLMHVDMYGSCGNRTLPRTDALAHRVLRNYKFYLSLENSCCSEYLTEKVWNALEKWESVPIVLGGTKEEYTRLMPPHSYIHVDDFDSVEDLASYLLTVSRNATMYNNYFEWRSIGTVKQQTFQQRFPVFKAGACKVADKISETHTEAPPKIHSFDPYDPTWFGSCYRCGVHGWIQDYNFWWRRTIFSEEWEDNRTLYWLNNN